MLHKMVIIAVGGKMATLSPLLLQLSGTQRIHHPPTTIRPTQVYAVCVALRVRPGRGGNPPGAEPEAITDDPGPSAPTARRASGPPLVRLAACQ